MLDFLVIIPAYNADKEIKKTLKQVLCIVKNPEKIIVIDDSSEDFTSQIVSEFDVVLLKHTKNRGKGAALKTGFEFANKKGIKWVLTIDSDNQHNPDKIPLFLQELQKSPCDLLIGKRQLKIKKMPFDRCMSNKITSLLISFLCRTRIYDSQCGFRLINTELLKKQKLTTNRFETESELLIKYSKAGAKIGQVPISTIYSTENSTIDKLGDTYRFVKMYLAQIW